MLLLRGRQASNKQMVSTEAQLHRCDRAEAFNCDWAKSLEMTGLNCLVVTELKCLTVTGLLCVQVNHWRRRSSHMYLHQQHCKSMAAAYSLPLEQPFVSAAGRDVIYTPLVQTAMLLNL